MSAFFGVNLGEKRSGLWNSLFQVNINRRPPDTDDGAIGTGTGTERRTETESAGDGTGIGIGRKSAGTGIGKGEGVLHILAAPTFILWDY